MKMKNLIFSLFMLICGFLNAQIQRTFTAQYQGNDLPELFGIHGIYESPGNSTGFYNSTWNPINSQADDVCLSFLKTENYVPSARHYKINAQAYYPIHSQRIEQHNYLVGVEYQNQSAMFSIMKTDLNGTILKYRIIENLIAQNPQAEIQSIPNSSDLLLCLQSAASDGSAEIYFFSLDDNLEPTGVQTKIQFSEAALLGYQTHFYKGTDFLWKDSVIYYASTLYNGDSLRLETGNLNLTNNATASYHFTSEANEPSHWLKPFVQLVKVQNDSINLLYKNSLKVFPLAQQQGFSYNLEQLFNGHETHCTKLVETASGDWLGLALIESDLQILSLIAKFKPEPETMIDVYSAPFIGYDISNLNDDIHIWGLKNSMASAVIDEFNSDDIETCHDFVQNKLITVNSFTIHESEITLSAVSVDLADLSLPVEINPTLNVEVDCNPEFLTIENLNEEKLRVYPNPSTDFLHIETGENETLQEICLLNLTGKVLYRKTSCKRNEMITLNEIPSGLYLLEVKTESVTHQKKIIIGK